MRNLPVTLFLISIIVLSSCAVNRNYTPAKKYPKEALREDFTLMRSILEKKHPSLYWYTSKDSMDRYFDYYYRAINDSMSEQQFAWHILAPVVDKIHCGHTSVSMSKAFGQWSVGRRLPSFPLFLKIWNDTMAVTGSLTRRDSIFKRGTIIKAINGQTTNRLVNNMFNYLPEDGRANNFNYIRLSSNFPYYHRNIMGLSKTYFVSYIDSTGKAATATVPLYTPPRDSIRKDSLKRMVRPKQPRVNRILAHRSLVIDSSKKLAVLTLNSFTRGHLRTFFRRTFRTLEKENINNLVLDIRSNGGGRVGLSTLLTKYISREPFKVADSLYAVTRNLGPYTKHVKGKFLNNIELLFISHKKKDGLYHIRHLEKKVYNPKKKRYNGDVYVLTSGPTFSASTIFSNAVKGQPGITLLGEETGGGWHGNNGIMIPDVTLPNTKTRFRLPLFRLVQFNHQPKTGTGIIPDIYVGTSYDALLKSYDKKMQVVKERIFLKDKEQ